jgi:xylose isomerase
MKYSNQGAKEILGHQFDRAALAAKRLQYERLDQLTMEVMFGIR